VGKLEGKRPLGRIKHNWVDNIKMDNRKIGWRITNLIEMAHDEDRRGPLWTCK
jgi:hypothetical protein